MSPNQSIKFNQQDPDTVAFLQDIGVDPDKIQAGEIPLFDTPIRPKALFKLASLDGEVDYYFSPNEASRGRRLIEQFGQKAVSRIFRQDLCPGSSIPAQSEMESTGVADTMLSHALGLPKEFSREGVTSSHSCPYDPSLPTWLQSGIHYVDAQESPGIQAIGQSVLPIETIGKRQYGSAVLVSDDGHLITARHVLFEQGSTGIRSPLYVRLGDNIYEIRPEDVLYENEESDTALIHVRGLAGLPHIPVDAVTPEKGMEVVAVGYPKEDAPGFAVSKDPRLYSHGQVIGGTGPGEKTLINAETYHGYSGGLVFERDTGRFLGIVIDGIHVKNPLGETERVEETGVSRPPPELLDILNREKTNTVSP